jgi:amino acid adenylation domain-containing protein
MQFTTDLDGLLIFDEKTIEARNYWLKKFSDDLLPSNIKSDFHRPASYSGETGTVELNLDAELYEGLMKLTGQAPFLLFTVLVTALNICLYKYTGLNPVVIGSASLKADDASSQSKNALTIVTDIDEEQSFRQFLVNTRQTLLEAYEKQDYPFNRLLKDLGIEKIDNKCPLFDIALVLKNIHHDLPAVRNDITMIFSQEPGYIAGQVVFNGSLFRPQTIEGFVKHFQALLHSAIKNTNALISQLQVLSREERHQILVEWNNTQTDYPQDKCLHKLFEDHAQHTPDAPALFYGDRDLTYRELNQRANQMAHYLQRLGVGPDSLVGICMYRSLELIIGLLGTLKAGGAYVPLDPTYPKERLADMMEDANMKVLLTENRLLELLPRHQAEAVCLDNHWEVVAREDTQFNLNPVTVHNLVYVIFTSGSTGRPKGAAVYHRGWTNLMHWFVTEFKIASPDKVLVISSFSFDITQRSIAMPLIVGAQLHLLSSDFYDPELILQTIWDKKISLMNCSPSTFYPLIENFKQDAFEKLRPLRILFLGGEAISASRLEHWAGSCKDTTEVANVYGAAECTDVSSFYVLKDYKRYIKTSVPVGKPIFNSQVYILDRNLRPVPFGAAGEICIAGDGVGKGYINDDALTREKFVPNPFSGEPGAELYRTGDLGRFLPDWDLEFIGRVDHQVKVRGFRIDLGDIETALRQHEAIKEAVVVNKEYAPGDQRLLAYLVPEQPGELPQAVIEELKLFLKEKLPEYMIPNIFVSLENIPLNPNGKVDRDALPDPETTGIKVGSETPRNPTEENIATIFAEVLKLERLGIFDNFFDLGGHSLLVTEAISRVNDSFQVKLSNFDLLADPTVAGLAQRLEMKQ